MTAALPLRLDYPHGEPPPAGGATEVAPGVLWLRMPLPFALDHINLWLLADGDGWTLVDCGYGGDVTRELWERHFATTLEGRPIRRIIATHYHPDHLGNAEWLATRFGCRVAMTPTEFLTAHAMAGQHSGYALSGTIAFLRRHGLSEAHIAALAARGNQYLRGVPTLPLLFDRLQDGDMVRIGERRWRILVGHGHSPEHASLACIDDGLLISGDMLLPRISTNVSVWAVEPDADPVRRFLDSLTQFESLPPQTLVLPSHGLPFRGIALRGAELRGHHAARLDELEAALRSNGPSSAASILPVLFRRELDLQQRFFAMGEAIAHLNYLWHAGRLQRLDDAGDRIRYAALH